MTVIIGVNPHKATHTAVAIDGAERPLARLDVVADRSQTQRLLAWAAPFGERRWAIESAEGLGKLLAQQLLGAGEDVVDVPPTLAARVRLLGSTKAAKNDPNDALAIAIAGLRHCGLRTVRVDDHTAVIRMLVDRYDDLTRLRTQAACRLHVTLRELVAGGAPRLLSADRAARLLRSVRPSGSRPTAARPRSRASSGPTKRHRLNSGATASRTTPRTRRRSPRSDTTPRVASATTANSPREVEGSAARLEAPHQRRRLATAPRRPRPLSGTATGLPRSRRLGATARPDTPPVTTLPSSRHGRSQTMTNTTDTPIRDEFTSSPDTQGPHQTQRGYGTRRGWLTWVGVLAAAAAAVALVVVALSGRDDGTTTAVVGAHRSLTQHGSIRSIEGSVEDTVDPRATGANAGFTEHGSIRSIEGSVEDTIDARATDPDAGRAAQAKQAEREAHVEGQASTHGRASDPEAGGSNGYPPNYYPHGFNYQDTDAATDD
jgi:Transposase